MVPWVLVFHLIGLVFWLGSLLVVTHVLAVHSEEPSPEARATLGRLEMKLFKGLAHPGAALMVITGAILIGENPHYLREFWLHAKLLLVAVLIALDLRVYFRATAHLMGRVELRRRECKALHGAISLVFFGILILVLLKPFSAGTSPRLQAGLLSPLHRRGGAGLVGSALLLAHGQPQGLPLRCGAEAGGTPNEDHG
jgi:putative membrane protein